MFVSRFRFIVAGLCAFWASGLEAQTTEQIQADPALAVTVSTEIGKVYNLERSSDTASWSPWQSFILGDGGEASWVAALDGEGAYARTVSNPVVDVSGTLASLRSTWQVPALAAAVVKNGELVGIGATGNRRFGVDAPVTLNDKWHHGSITKSMTATLAAIMVEAGIVEWTTTVGNAFPARVSAMGAGWSDVTLEQLLANSGGVPGGVVTNEIWATIFNFQGTPKQGRELLVDLTTVRDLEYTPETQYVYSNFGFAIAGAMLETIAGKPWEDLMRELLFAPLGMTSAGFGPPATPRQLDQPFGHSGTAASPTVWPPADSADNPAGIGPAGTVHATILDMARYIAFHLAGSQGETDLLLSQATFAKLHTDAYGFGYARSWSVFDTAWSGDGTLQHTGSNTQWYTNIWIMPEKNWACVVSINFGGTNAFEATNAGVSQMIAQFPLD